MAEDLRPPRPGSKAQAYAGLGYQVGVGLLAIGLLLVRTDLGRMSVEDWLLFLVLLLISILCEELGFRLGDDIRVDLGGLFSAAAVLTLGYNGVWVPLLTNLYWLIKIERHRLRTTPAVALLAHSLSNLGMNVLPPWLGLYAYHDLLGGQLPLADLPANLLPVAAFVVVDWLVLLVGISLLILLAERGVRATAQWFGDILAGFALTVYVPILFSPAVAVVLNSLGLGFFLFIAIGLLGISMLAQRLAHSLASEQRRVEELTVLNAISDDIIHTPPGVAATGELLARHAPHIVPGADFELCLFDEGEPELRQVVVDWRAGAAQPTGDAPLTPLWTWLCNERRSLLVPDVPHGPLPFDWDIQADGPLPGSLLLAPLLVGDPAAPPAGRCIGGIRMSHAEQDAFSPETLPSLTALAHQLAAALENARLHQEALARERLERELALARDIQNSFLPASVPQVEGWLFVASLEPARQVSGDFYDFIPLPGDRWGILIADVADKGMPAALYMALARTLIRAHAPDHAGDPAACLLAVNNQILADARSDLFVTVFYGILDPTTGEMAFANAGHSPPLLCHGDGRPADWLRNTGMALGVVPDAPLANGRTTISGGDCLVLYTDGVTEAHDRDLVAFGNDRLLAAVEAGGSAPAGEIHRQILAAVAEFAGDSPPYDDLTLMVIGRETLKG